MNTKRLIFWISFVIIIGLIIWGLIVAMNKAPKTNGLPTGTPAAVGTADHVLGSENAAVTLVEYSDFQCPACQAYFYVVEKMMASSTVPFRFVYRHFPLSQHLNTIPASMAAEAAGVQGKFWDMYRLLFENQADWAELTDASKVFEGYADDLGLDQVRFKTDAASSTLRDRITANSDEGLRLGINSTPTFFLNGKAITNPSNYEEFKTLIEEAAQDSSN